MTNNHGLYINGTELICADKSKVKYDVIIPSGIIVIYLKYL